jgi:small subunit ribosomal protein S16
MVKLRLRRRGRKKHPFYDIVAIDGRARRDGAALERVGYVDPMTTPKNVVLDTDRAIYWLNVGAQPTDIVRQILSREGVLLQRQMQFKGKTADEIEAAVAEHKANAVARYERLKQRRKDRTVARAKAADEEARAKAEAEAAATAAPVAEAPAAEAQAEEAPVAEVPAEEAPASDAPAEDTTETPAE